VLAIRALRALDRVLRTLEVAVVTMALLVMVGLSFAQVVLRNAHIAALPPKPWIPLVAQHLVLWVGMVGASLAAADRRHISIEVLSKAVSAQGRRVVEGLVDLATIFVCALLAYVAWRFVFDVEKPGEPIVAFGEVTIRTWHSFTILPVGFALIAFRYFRLLVERIFVDAPVADEHEVEQAEFDATHDSGERPAAAAADAPRGTP
jgi:TRAP-type C4-dicarboxylate transport system permease small subunit